MKYSLKPFFLFLIIVFFLSLSGCFAFLKRDKFTKPVAPQDYSIGEKSVSENVPLEKQPYIPVTPSFQDGDYYWDALSTRKLEPCEKITNPALKARCRMEVKRQPG